MNGFGEQISIVFGWDQGMGKGLNRRLDHFILLIFIFNLNQMSTPSEVGVHKSLFNAKYTYRRRLATFKMHCKILGDVQESRGSFKNTIQPKLHKGLRLYPFAYHCWDLVFVEYSNLSLNYDNLFERPIVWSDSSHTLPLMPQSIG